MECGTRGIVYEGQLIVFLSTWGLCHPFSFVISSLPTVSISVSLTGTVLAAVIRQFVFHPVSRSHGLV